MKTARKWLASLLVAAMVLCAMPMALAAEKDDDQKKPDTTAQAPAETEKTEDGEKTPAEDDKTPAEGDKAEDDKAPAEGDKAEDDKTPAEGDKAEDDKTPAEGDKAEDDKTPAEGDKAEDDKTPAEGDKAEDDKAPAEGDKAEDDKTPAEGDKAEDDKAAEPAAPKFADVAPTSPFAAAIDWAVAKEITLGKTETSFGPTDPCTVSHILTFLWRANGKPGAEEGVADRDSAAKWAVENEMIAEDADLTATCTRSMAVTFMWKAAESPEVETEKEFTDVKADAEYAGAVAWAVENEITAGTGDGTTFAPENPCNRGQIVTFLYRQLAEKDAEPAA